MGEAADPRPEDHDHGAERAIAASFVVSLLSSLALAAVYWRGGQPQLEGVFLALALGGFGVGLVMWGRRLLPHQLVTQEREALPTTGDERRELVDSLERGRPLGRRSLLVRLLAAAGGAFGLAAFFPIRSLGPSPGRSLEETAWRSARRLVNEDGVAVRADDVPLGGLVTVFPEGHEGSADAQTVLIRVRPGTLDPRPGREDWAPEGLVAYSKVCTHAGCPVGLYDAGSHQLLCPCHQSAFDVLDAAEPVFGPAARALPQLPLDIDDDGFLRARGDFSEPVGPAWWTRP